MKLLIFTIAAVLTLATGLKGQDYVSFPTENVNWHVYYTGTCEEKAPDTILFIYSIHGDTIINEITYKKLYLEKRNTANSTIEAIGGIREKDKKIYYNGSTILTSTNGKEYLLYDFTKQTGDTIKHHSGGEFYSVILNTDSISIDGTYRKRYEIKSHSFGQSPDYIIEGIGSVVNGLLGNISDITTCGTHYWEHICFKENEIVKYLNPNFSDCFPLKEWTEGNYEKTDTLKLHDAYCEANNPHEIDTTTFSYQNDTLYIRNIHSGICDDNMYRAIVNHINDSLKIDIINLNGDCTGDCSMGYTIKIQVASFDTLHITIRDENFTVIKSDIVMSAPHKYLQNIKIYPNPVTSHLRISGENINTIEIIDLYGNVLLRKFNPTNSVNLNHLKAGIYIVSISTDNYNQTTKILKQ
uniref:T9SS type A sorting domain-containing protein n=1 Tax=uncultured Draconibacterium sp. TaxID=1573823 RepID=UPI0032175680